MKRVTIITEEIVVVYEGDPVEFWVPESNPYFNFKARDNKSHEIVSNFLIENGISFESVIVNNHCALGHIVIKSPEGKNYEIRKCGCTKFEIVNVQRETYYK